MLHPFRTVAAVAALGLVGAAVLTFNGDDEVDQVVGLPPVSLVSLTTEHDCTDLLTYYREQATRLVGPYGVDPGGPDLMAAAEGGAAAKAAPNVMRAAGGSAAADSTTPDSTTNVQVAGVDESDVVKTSGDLMVAVVNGEVQITRLAGAGTKTLAHWKPAEGSAQSVVLEGGTAVIIGDRNGGIPLGATKMRFRPGGYNASVTDLTVLDLTDPAHPRPVRRLELAGTRSGEARSVDGELRIALTARPSGITWKQPVYPNSPTATDTARQIDLKQAEKLATQANRALIAKSTIDNWIPSSTVTELDAAGKPTGTAVHKPLLDCEKVAVPSSFSGINTLALVSLDLRAQPALTTWRSAGVIASGSTLYATADHAWIATSRWNATRLEAGSSNGQFAPDVSSTDIHRFDTPLRQEPKYVASGEITGTLLSQFSMDEKDGLLRVASTTQGASDLERTSSAPSTTAAFVPTPPEGRITVLTVDGSKLARIGLVAGMGKGEQIRGVRFVGDTGYVVTYRQTDPLYTVDLTDPTDPQVRGELKVLGYSAYLHPAGAGRLLGLGQDGTKGGQTTGLQLSLFDVSDLKAPNRLDQVKLAQAWSDAEGDHHAFTMVGDLVLIPYTQWTSASVKVSPSESGVASDGSVAPDGAEPVQSRFDAGVIAVRVGADGIGTPTTLRPIADGPVEFDSVGEIKPKIQRLTSATPIRTVVQGGTIYTLTAEGVAAHTSTTFSRLTFADF
jgi:hypothetical protein